MCYYGRIRKFFRDREGCYQIGGQTARSDSHPPCIGLSYLLETSESLATLMAYKIGSASEVSGASHITPS